MKLFRITGLLISTLLILSFSIKALAEELEKSKSVSIHELISNGRLRASVQGAGGHEGECIQMYLENPSPDTAFFRIEPGRVLSSLDTAVQDILITREELLSLAPGEQRMIDIYGFCGQASYASPDTAEMFSVGEMADSSVVVLAEFLNERDNNFPEDAIQKAVWCLTDDHDVDEIYSRDLASIADLRTLVASLKGTDEQWFSIENVSASSGGYSYYTKTITGEFDIFIPVECKVDIYICDEYGKKWDEFEKAVPYRDGTYQYSFRLTATNWPKGKYFMCILGDGVFLYKKEFNL